MKVDDVTVDALRELLKAAVIAVLVVIPVALFAGVVEVTVRGAGVVLIVNTTSTQ
jgi:hypothetical protein